MIIFSCFMTAGFLKKEGFFLMMASNCPSNSDSLQNFFILLNVCEKTQSETALLYDKLFSLIPANVLPSLLLYGVTEMMPRIPPAYII